MAISKRLRFEILRRDNYTCRYCGASAPDVKLVVDHVKPEALGGQTVPENLVTACEPCNSGKTSIAPDSPLVDDVQADAQRWGAAMARAAELLGKQDAAADRYAESFRLVWMNYTVGSTEEKVPLPDDWPETLGRFYKAGLPQNVVTMAVATAMGNSKVTVENVFRYFCGVCWNRVAEMQEIAQQLLAAEEAIAEARAAARDVAGRGSSPVAVQRRAQARAAAERE